MSQSPVPTFSDPASPWVLVLLPVYNGQRFLTQQVESILNQSGVSTHILCRDDGSSDGSPGLLHELRLRSPERITVVEDDLGNLGASGNFSCLMQLALDLEPSGFGRAAYIALSDQDDVWHDDKVAIGLATIRSLEQARPGAPALVHSDLRVIEEDGREIAPSMARYQGLRPDLSSLPAQLLSNTLTGCTSLMNRALLEKALPVPPEAIMHDWWLSLVASALGSRRYLDQSLIDYRQHASNAIGAKAQDKPVAFKTIVHRLFDDRHGEIFRLNARQARGFMARFGGELTARQRLTTWLASQLSLPFPPLQRLIYRVLRRL
ncbi:glycosyltransferase family 2 protein [Hydrogenophaga sp. NH-16]|uniref:glycosyltransferase family 2 protein n=1 Tax=Hydrogenophaga sp. NH-16 TaxID=2184519 RepID=UPI000FDC6EED|nr:glycosyltransferase family 2 protein [Hydrogenophaga sp. NH-16]